MTILAPTEKHWVLPVTLFFNLWSISMM